MKQILDFWLNFSWDVSKMH